MMIADNLFTLINRTICIIEGAMSIDSAILKFSHINCTICKIVSSLSSPNTNFHENHQQRKIGMLGSTSGTIIQPPGTNYTPLSEHG